MDVSSIITKQTEDEQMKIKRSLKGKHDQTQEEDHKRKGEVKIDIKFDANRDKCIE